MFIIIAPPTHTHTLTHSLAHSPSHSPTHPLMHMRAHAHQMREWCEKARWSSSSETFDLSWLRTKWIEAFNRSESAQADDSTAMSRTIAAGKEWSEFSHVTVDILDNSYIR
jgi:hypothetical protein